MKGWGKTSLINTIYDLYRYNLLKIIIDASFTDNYIDVFIVKNKLNEGNNEFKEKEDEGFEEKKLF